MEGLFGRGNWLYIILIGFIVGVLARLLKPGKDSMGIILTTLLGIAGALLAGWVGQATGFYEAGETAGFIGALRSEEHTSELQSLMRTSFAVFCLQIQKITD